MKVTGPAFSLAASGTIGGMITASRWKGRPYFRTRVTPHNPRSAGQTAQRAMFKFLSQNWAALVGAPQASWATLAAASNVSPFNAYQKYNMQRWTHVLAPGETYPVGSTGTPTAPGAAVATAGVKQITVTSTAGMVAANTWGGILFANNGGAPSGVKAEVIAVVLAHNATPLLFVHTGLTTGDVWHYKWQTFSEDGALGTLGADGSTTVL